MKLLLVDLDGTVRQTVSGKKFINTPLDQQLMPHVEMRLDEAIVDGWTIIGVTNQGGVAAGFKSLEDAIAEQEETLRLAAQISEIFFCPDAGQTCINVDRDGTQGRSTLDGDATDYRKPNPGMLLRAHKGQKWERILMIGDRDEDELAAKAAQIEFMWAHTWHSEGLV